MSKRVALPVMMLMALGCSACGDESGTDPLTFEQIAGQWVGSFDSTEADGDNFVALVTIDFVQNEGTLTGTFVIDGTITGNGTVSTTSQGLVTGTLPLGANPTFSVDLAFDFCPNDPLTFSMSLNSAAGTITMSGGLDILSSACNVLTVYPLNFTLSPE